MLHPSSLRSTFRYAAYGTRDSGILGMEHGMFAVRMKIYLCSLDQSRFRGP